jgi:hypothetical protein
VWHNHLGCNFSHGLGLAFLGAVQLLLRRSNALLLAATPVVPLATVMTVAWAVLAATCWFWVPFVALALAALGFARTWYALCGIAALAPAPAADVRLLSLGVLAMGVAGTFHGLGTFPDFFVDGFFSPASPGVRRAMAGSNLLLPGLFGATTPAWDAYLGFNLSHGLGVAGFALTAWLLARDLPGVLARDRALRALFAAASLFWFAVAITCWFYAPMAVAGMAATCHLAFLWRRPHTLNFVENLQDSVPSSRRATWCVAPSSSRGKAPKVNHAS